jgi:hypothetical protein
MHRDNRESQPGEKHEERAIGRWLVQGEMTMTRMSDEGSIICAPQGEDSEGRGKKSKYSGGISGERSQKKREIMAK